MKIRLKYNSLSKVLTLDDNNEVDITLDELFAVVSEQFGGLAKESVFLSLNKKDPLEGENKTLKDFGVVSGDLIHVISSESPSTGEKLTATSAGISFENYEKATCSRNAECQSQESSQSTHTVTGRVETTQNNLAEPSSSGTFISEASCSSTSNVMEVDQIEQEPIDLLTVQRCLNEPMLCRECKEGQVTALLNEVFSSVECSSIQEALCVALHVLMLEVGYLPFDNNGATGHDQVVNLHSINREWKQRAPACFTLKFTHSLAPDGDTIFSLTCVPMGQLMIIHGQMKIDDKDEKCQLQLKPSEYIPQITAEAFESYINLPKLSRLFKDAIALPLLQRYREAKNLAPLYGFLALTHEIKLKVFGYLDAVSALKVSETCKTMYDISRDRYIWRRIYLRDFGNRQNNSLAQDWFKLYKQEYRNRKERRKLMSQFRMVVPPFIPSNPYASRIPPPVAPFHPGMIGGEYDLYPQYHGVPNPMFGRRGQGGQPLNPGMRPRIDPFGPLPDSTFRPGRGGGIRDNRGPFGRGGGFGGPKLF